MQVLDPELKVQNRKLKLVKRQGRVAMYELFGHGGMLYGYEVVVIRIRKEHEAFGKHFPEMEALPRNEEWGTYGWSYRDLAGAIIRYSSLLPRWGENVVPSPDLDDLDPFEGHDSGQPT